MCGTGTGCYIWAVEQANNNQLTSDEVSNMLGCVRLMRHACVYGMYDLLWLSTFAGMVDPTHYMNGTRDPTRKSR